jgi:deoxyribodipyrimidine photo-lyase
LFGPTLKAENTLPKRANATRPVLLWYRRDLRLADHPVLANALTTGKPVIPVYVLDDHRPGKWRHGGASRWWLANSLASLDADLRKHGSQIILRRGETIAALLKLADETGADAVYFTRGYEPYSAELEEELAPALRERGIDCRRFPGQLLNEPEAIRNKTGEPFKVFTPFHKACLAMEAPAVVLPTPANIPAPEAWPASDELAAWRLEPTKPDWAGGLREHWRPGELGAQARLRSFIHGALDRYGVSRDLPGLEGTSRLSPHLAFGEISPRQVWHAIRHAADSDGLKGADAYLRELYWREFFYNQLFHWPVLPEKPFRPAFERFPWRRDADALRAWQKGETGYPIVDAGMRQLWATGWMHNRVRMIVASFLVKHLLIPWQDGAAWFWDTLVDADLANNSASWQWVAGLGADAAPYFRVFNPILQGRKFDAAGNYVRRWLPELAGLSDKDIHTPWQSPEMLLAQAGVTLGKSYPKPIVDHDEGRTRALAAYRAITGDGPASSSEDA